MVVWERESSLHLVFFFVRASCYEAIKLSTHKASELESQHKSRKLFKFLQNIWRISSLNSKQT